MFSIASRCVLIVSHLGGWLRAPGQAGPWLPGRRSGRGAPTWRSGVRLVPGPAAITLGAAAATDLALVALVLCAGRGTAGARGGAARIAGAALARALLRRALVRFLRRRHLPFPFLRRAVARLPVQGSTPADGSDRTRTHPPIRPASEPVRPVPCWESRRPTARAIN